MKDFCIYTVNVGGYDYIQQPAVVDQRFDYILFTDESITEFEGVWRKKTIPFLSADKSQLSRYPKMHPSELLKEYKASLYIDANIQIANADIYNKIVALFEKGVEWGSIAHSDRDCIYDEAYTVMTRGIETEDNVFRWCHYLRKNAYPRHNGLYENNIIYRKHDELVKQVDDQWWNLYLHNSRRDQLTLCFVLQQFPELNRDLLLPVNENSWNSKCFHRVNKHNSSSRQKQTESIFVHYRNRIRGNVPYMEKRFKDFHYFLYGLPPCIAKILLLFWTIYVIIRYGFQVKYEAYKRRNGK